VAVQARKIGKVFIDSKWVIGPPGVKVLMFFKFYFSSRVISKNEKLEMGQNFGWQYKLEKSEKCSPNTKILHDKDFYSVVSAAAILFVL
jgi:hypothetical protein